MIDDALISIPAGRGGRVEEETEVGAMCRDRGRYTNDLRLGVVDLGGVHPERKRG